MIIHTFLKNSLSGLFMFLAVIFPYTVTLAEPVIIDHTCTDLSQIPDEWIDAAQANIKTYYAHTSHGRQLLEGLWSIEGSYSNYEVEIGNETLSVQTGSLCIYDKNSVTPPGYWSSARGIQDTQNVLNSNPSINVSMWSWCGEPSIMTEEEMDEYLNAIAAFEAANPGVTFIYMTGHAQFAGIEGYNRHQRNEQIRRWVRDSDNRVLFDFADLDSWWFNPQTQQWEHATYEHSNIEVPVEHPQFNDINNTDYGHTTLESCEQKGKATWWMMATLAGWNNGGPVNQQPVADAGLNRIVGPGVDVELDGSGSYDPDGDDITFYWEQISGTNVGLPDNTTEKPSFISPDVEGGLVFRLTVSDNEGLSDMDTCIVNVTISNEPPIAEAGDDMVVNAGQDVELDGSGSYDPDGDDIIFHWEQNSGQTVELSDAASVTPTFIAPANVLHDEMLGFELYITDEVNLIASDAVMVTVKQNNVIPEQENPDDDSSSGSCLIASTYTYSDKAGLCLLLWALMFCVRFSVRFRNE